ncbi:hypothetical protein EMCRGX_G020385 [Ephydatia muelleri]
MQKVILQISTLVTVKVLRYSIATHHFLYQDLSQGNTIRCNQWEGLNPLTKQVSYHNSAGTTIVMGTCGCGCLFAKNAKDEKLQYDADFRGPIRGRARRPKDILCLALFLIFICLYLAVGVYAWANGNPNRLLYPVDTKGRLCGVDDGVNAQPYTSHPSAQPYTTLPSAQPYTTLPSAQPYTTHPSAQPYTTLPSAQPYTTLPSAQPYTAHPSAQPYTTLPSAQPYTTLPSAQPSYHTS